MPAHRVHPRESLFLAAIALSASLAFAQPGAAPANSPVFEAATIKPCAPDSATAIGFLSYPGGRVVFGHSTLKTILYFAYDIPPARIQGGPDCVAKDEYEITAVPPDSAASLTANQPPRKATPSEEQRQMLRSLLTDRFALRVHTETAPRPVYLLTLGSKKLQLKEPKYKDSDARFAVVTKSGGFVDGETFGQNISMARVAKALSTGLDLPVIDETGLTGKYDFQLDPDDPENHDYPTAVFDAMDRLGLKLKRGTGPVETLVIDHVERPTEN